MKHLEQLIARGKAEARSFRARLPLGRPQPSRVVLQLNDQGVPVDLARATGEALDLKGWQESLVLMVEWLGPTRVTFSGGEPAQSDLLLDLVRFANRLECPTHVVSRVGFSESLLEELVDRGLGAITLVVGGLDDATHRKVVGTSLDEISSALHTAQRVREGRGRPLEIYVGIPLAEDNLEVVGSIAGWARQAGVDGVLGMLPMGSPVPSGGAGAIAKIGEKDQTSLCLVERLDGGDSKESPRPQLLADGTLVASPFGPVVGRLPEEHPRELWKENCELVAQAQPKGFDEVELIPRVLYSQR